MTLKRILLGAVFAGTLVLGSAAGAMAADLIAIITPSHDNPFFKAEADGAVGPEEAVRAYHGELQKLGIKPARSFEDDNIVTEAPLKQTAKLKAA